MGRKRISKAGTRDERTGAKVPQTAAHKWVWNAVIVAVVTVVAFAPTFSNSFTYLDDDINIFQNPYLNPPTWKHLAWLWRHAYAHLYVPLVYTSYALDVAIGGTNPQ